MTRHGIWLLWLLCLPAWGQGWQLQTGGAGILLWTRAHPPGAFLALRLEMNVAAPPSALLAVLRDTARHQEWLPQSLEVRVLAKPAPDEDLVYTRLSAPWPVQERELITHSRLRRNADCSLQLTVWAAPDALPPHPGRVRIRASEGRWEALPQLNGTTLVRLETYTNPGDSLPSWLINPIATQAALDSFRAIRRLMEAMPPHLALVRGNIRLASGIYARSFLDGRPCSDLRLDVYSSGLSRMRH